MGSQFTEGNGRAVNITAWRKKGGSVWNYCRDVIKQKKEEEKRAQMIEAKKETASLEKLREQKLDAYNKAVQKSEEAMIDELVSRARAVAAGASA